MILFACPLMFLLLPLPFLVRRFLPPVKGLHGDALRVPFCGTLPTSASVRAACGALPPPAGKNFSHVLVAVSGLAFSDGCRRPAAVAGRAGEDQGLRPRHYAGDGHFHFHAGA